MCMWIKINQFLGIHGIAIRINRYQQLLPQYLLLLLFMIHKKQKCKTSLVE